MSEDDPQYLMNKAKKEVILDTLKANGNECSCACHLAWHPPRTAQAGPHIYRLLVLTILCLRNGWPLLRSRFYLMRPRMLHNA